jgi:hypothetical protein
MRGCAPAPQSTAPAAGCRGAGRVADSGGRRGLNGEGCARRRRGGAQTYARASAWRRTHIRPCKQGPHLQRRRLQLLLYNLDAGMGHGGGGWGRGGGNEGVGARARWQPARCLHSGAKHPGCCHWMPRQCAGEGRGPMHAAAMTTGGRPPLCRCQQAHPQRPVPGVMLWGPCPAARGSSLN